jgi:hypothetical protein
VVLILQSFCWGDRPRFGSSRETAGQNDLLHARILQVGTLWSCGGNPSKYSKSISESIPLAFIRWLCPLTYFRRMRATLLFMSKLDCRNISRLRVQYTEQRHNSISCLLHAYADNILCRDTCGDVVAFVCGNYICWTHHSVFWIDNGSSSMIELGSYEAGSRKSSTLRHFTCSFTG